MKNVIKKLFGVVITIALTAVIVHGLGYIVRPVETDVCFKSIEDFHNFPENTAEVIGFGSSHMWRGFEPITMYKNYGIGAYNYGCNWQHINTTYLFFKDALRTQKPKVVLIETYMVNDPLWNTNMNGEIYYTRALKESKEKLDYLKFCFGRNPERFLSYYMPLCAFHDNWTSVNAGSFVNQAKDLDYQKTFGYAYADGVETIEIPDQSNVSQQELSPEVVTLLDNMVSVCKENDIQIIFYTAPYQGEYAFSDAMKKYVAENDCVYINFFEKLEESGINGAEDFSDPGHLNVSGAGKVADYLGRFIVENYEVTDFRGVPDNIWYRSM